MFDTFRQMHYTRNVKSQIELNCYKNYVRRFVMASTKRYFGLSWVVCLILAIIPFTSLICGVITRAQRGAWLGLVLNILLIPVFWVIDLVTMIVSRDITVLA